MYQLGPPFPSIGTLGAASGGLCRAQFAARPDYARRVAIYIGWIQIDPAVSDKLKSKHNGLTETEVREAFQWPARLDARWESSVDHGERLVAIGRTGDGRDVIGWLLPVDAQDGTWILKSARYV